MELDAPISLDERHLSSSSNRCRASASAISPRSWHGPPTAADAQSATSSFDIALSIGRRHRSVPASLDFTDRRQQFWRLISHDSHDRSTVSSRSQSSEVKQQWHIIVEAVSIFSNILAGPGILGFPLMVQNSGWLVTLVVLMLFSTMTACTGSLLAKALRDLSLKERRRGEGDYPRYELSDMVNHLFGRSAFLFFQVLLNVGMFLLCLASLVVAGDTVNKLIISLFGDSLELRVTGEGGFGFAKACVAGTAIDVCILNQYQTTRLGVTLGYAVVVCLCLPLTLTDFANKMWFQYVATAVTIAAIMIFVITCFLPSSNLEAKWHAPDAFGSDPALSIATCFLSFAITFVVPSWWNDNHRDCLASRSINTSVFYTLIVYYLPMAFLPAFAFTFPNGEDALTLFLDPTSVNLAAVVAAYALAIVGIMPNVIAYSVAMRGNLQAIGPWFTVRTSTWIACVGPFFIGWCLDNATGFGATFVQIMDWSSVGLLGCVSYVIPLLLVLKVAHTSLLEGDTAFAQHRRQDAPEHTNIKPCETWSYTDIVLAGMLLGIVLMLILCGYMFDIYTLAPHPTWHHRQSGDHPHRRNPHNHSSVTTSTLSGTGQMGRSIDHW